MDQGYQAIIDFTSATSVAMLAAMNVAIFTGASLSIMKPKQYFLEISEKEWNKSYQLRSEQEGEMLIEIPLPRIFEKRLHRLEETLLFELDRQRGAFHYTINRWFAKEKCS
jgi:hypothetical protein